mgnify:CR=1 FL=1
MSGAPARSVGLEVVVVAAPVELASVVLLPAVFDVVDVALCPVALAGLYAAARVPDAAMQDRFADRIAFKARVTDEVVRAEIRRAAVQKQTTVKNRANTGFGQVTKAEKGLIWWLIHEPAPALTALGGLGARTRRGTGCLPL